MFDETTLTAPLLSPPVLDWAALLAAGAAALGVEVTVEHAAPLWSPWGAVSCPDGLLWLAPTAAQVAAWAAQEVAAHHRQIGREDGSWGCRCGWQQDAPHAEHVAAAVKASGGLR